MFTHYSRAPPIYNEPEAKSQPNPISLNNRLGPWEARRCETGKTAVNPRKIKTCVRALLYVGVAYSGSRTIYAAPVYKKEVEIQLDNYYGLSTIAG